MTRVGSTLLAAVNVAHLRPDPSGNELQSCKVRSHAIVPVRAIPN